MSRFDPSPASYVPPAATPPEGAVPRPQPGSATRVWTIPSWGKMDHVKRLQTIAEIGERASTDPRMRRLCVEIFREAGIEPRDYKGQADAILKYLQQHVYFLNERDEVLQDPAYTLDMQLDGTVGSRAHGDCDDFASTVIALCLSMHLPAVPVISGEQRDGRLVRYVYGAAKPPRAGYSHAYTAISPHPFASPKYDESWSYGDATVPRPRLGWDCVGAGLHDPQRARARRPGMGDIAVSMGDPGEVVEGFTPRTIITLIGVGVAVSLITDGIKNALKR